MRRRIAVRPLTSAATLAFALIRVVSVGLAAMLALPAVAEPLSPSWLEQRDGEAPVVFRVEDFIPAPRSHPLEGAVANAARPVAVGAAGTKDMVLLGFGRDSGIVVGSAFKTYRLSLQEHPLWVETGRLKAVEVQDQVTVASVEATGSSLAQVFFPKFPGVMAGDFAVMQKLRISRHQVLMPSQTLSYFDLFEDPKGSPGSFEMKASGLTELKEAAKAFAGARISLLMVEGHTDHNGPANVNQVESYQRALTVRQYLIDKLGFDPKRVVAIGYGESEPADTSMAPGYVEANRRIVLKAVPLDP